MWDSCRQTMMACTHALCKIINISSSSLLATNDGKVDLLVNISKHCRHSTYTCSFTHTHTYILPVSLLTWVHEFLWKLLVTKSYIILMCVCVCVCVWKCIYICVCVYVYIYIYIYIYIHMTKIHFEFLYVYTSVILCVCLYVWRYIFIS